MLTIEHLRATFAWLRRRYYESTDVCVTTALVCNSSWVY